MAPSRAARNGARAIPRVRKALVGLLAGAGLLLSVSACGAESGAVPSPTNALGAFQLLAQGYLDKAKDSGYSQDQVAILENALETGAVSFEDYKTAITASLDCVTQAGIQSQMYPIDDSRGFPTIDYQIEGPESGNPTADACVRENSEAVEALYQLQPSSVAAENDRFAKAVNDSIVPCLEQAGIPFDSDGMSTDELWNKLLQMSQDEGFPPDGSLGPVRTCMMNAGF